MWCFDQARKRRRRVIEVELTPITDLAISDGSAAHADRELVDQVLRRLDDRGRAIVVLHYYLGMPLSDVALTLGIPIGTVKSRLHRALGEMRLAIGPEPIARTRSDGRAAGMTIERRADLVLPPVLGELAGNANPDYLRRRPGRHVRACASGEHRRPCQRWLPVAAPAGASLARPADPWRGLAVALVILALLVASLALVSGAIRKQYAPAFGLAETGLVAFTDGDNIVATMPDGTGRRTLINADGVQWGAIWSHRGDRFAYWSATPATTDPGIPVGGGSRFGSNPRLVAGDLTSEQADMFPASSWSPDDRAARIRRFRRPVYRQRGRHGPAPGR